MELSHHDYTNGDFVAQKPLAFVMDALPEPQKKKGKKTAPTSKNFGNSLDISRVKSANGINIAWRCRLDIIQIDCSWDCYFVDPTSFIDCVAVSSH